MAHYSFDDLLKVLEVLFHEEDFQEDLREALADESGETLLAVLLGVTHPKLTDEELLSFAERFVSDLLHYTAELVRSAESDRQVLLQVKRVIAHDDVLKKSFTLPEARTLVSALRVGREPKLSLLDQISGSYLIVKACGKL